MKVRLMVEKIRRIECSIVSVAFLKRVIGEFEFKSTYAGTRFVYAALVPCGFDIECYKEHMYIWTLTIKDLTIIGYTWEEYIELMAKIKEALSLGKEVTVHHKRKTKEEYTTESAPYVLPVFIHNIKYEWSFMNSKIEYDKEKIFYMDKKEHNPMFVISEDAFLYIDSYKIYPMTLEEVAKCYCKTRKTHDLDYSVERTVEDAKHLSEKELTYCCNDTIILSELAQYTFDTYFIPYGRLPMTQNQIIKAIINNEYKTYVGKMTEKEKTAFESQLQSLTLTQDGYKFIRDQGFRGGYCQSSERDAKGDIRYGDLTSAYFTSIMHGYYPVTKYRRVRIRHQGERGIEDYCKDDRLCVTMRLKFYNIRSSGNKLVKYETKRKVTAYLPDGSTSTDKSALIAARKAIKGNSSGRIWKAPCFATTITEIDWEIYKKVYVWDKVEIIKIMVSDRGELPDYIKLTAAHLYENKAKLKKAGKTHCPEYYSAKTLVSNVFGCIVQRIDEATVNGDRDKWLATTLDAQLKPQWGVYITAHVRSVIVHMILALGIDNWLYSDTDSVYYIYNRDTKHIIDMYNLAQKAKNAEMCQKYGLDYELFDDLGCWDDDNLKITRFKTLGAKAYLYVTDTNEYKLVLAGIPEKFFWAAYEQNKDKDIFDFFECNTEITYIRKKIDYVKDGDVTVGCIINEDVIVGTLSDVQEKIAIEALKEEIESSVI